MRLAGGCIMPQSHLSQVYEGNATTIRLSPCPLCVTCSCNAILHVISLYCILVFQPLFLSTSFPQCTPLHSFTLVQICDNWIYKKRFHKNLNTIFQSNAQFFVHLKMVSKHALKNLSFISWDWKSIMIMSRIDSAICNLIYTPSRLLVRVWWLWVSLHT